MDENIIFERTSAGIPVITDTVGKADSSVFMIAVGTGSRDEPAETAGISHLLEHVVFRATKNRSSFQISKEIESAGGEMNAFTGKEVTAFYAASIKDTADVAKGLIADIFTNPLIRSDDVELEKKIVLQEISMWENDPESYIHKIFAETIWNGHALSKNEAGDCKSVSAMSSSELREYFEDRYKIPNIAIFATGAADADETLRWASDTFDRIGTGKETERTLPRNIRPRYSFVDRKGDHNYIGLGFRTYPADHKDINALTVLNAILGAGMSSRLFQRIREEKALVYSVFSTVDQNSDAGSMAAYMSSTKENCIESIETAVSVCKELRDGGLLKGEMERAKNLIKGVSARQMESTVNRSYRMTKRFMLTGKPESYNERMGMLDSVTEEDVMRVASDVIAHHNMAIAVYGTNDKKMRGFSMDHVDI